MIQHSFSATQQDRGNQYYKIENPKVAFGEITTITVSMPTVPKKGDILNVGHGRTYEFEVVKILEECPHTKRVTPNCILYKLEVVQTYGP